MEVTTETYGMIISVLHRRIPQRRQVSKCLFFQLIIWSSLCFTLLSRAKSSNKIRHPSNYPVGKAKEEEKRKEKKNKTQKIVFYETTYFMDAAEMLLLSTWAVYK